MHFSAVSDAITTWIVRNISFETVTKVKDKIVFYDMYCIARDKKLDIFSVVSTVLQQYTRVRWPFLSLVFHPSFIIDLLGLMIYNRVG